MCVCVLCMRKRELVLYCDSSLVFIYFLTYSLSLNHYLIFYSIDPNSIKDVGLTVAKQARKFVEDEVDMDKYYVRRIKGVIADADNGYYHCLYYLLDVPVQ